MLACSSLQAVIGGKSTVYLGVEPAAVANARAKPINQQQDGS